MFNQKEMVRVLIIQINFFVCLFSNVIMYVCNYFKKETLDVSVNCPRYGKAKPFYYTQKSDIYNYFFIYIKYYTYVIIIVYVRNIS